MAVFREAISTFQETKTKLEATRTRVQELNRFLDDLIQALRVAGRVDDALRRIGDVAGAFRRVLDAIIIPPAGPWGAVLRGMKAAAEGLLRAVEEACQAAGTALRSLDTVINRLRTKVQAVARLFGEVEQKITESMGVLDNLIAVCEFLETQQDDIEAMLGPAWVAQVRSLLAELRTAHARIEAFSREVDTIKAQLEPLAQQVRSVVDEVNNMADQLDRYASELQGIKAQYDQAARTVLGWINGLPQNLKNAIDQFWDAVGPVGNWVRDQVQPLINRIDRFLSDQGVYAKMDAARQRVAQAIDPITDKAKDVERKVEEIEALATALEASLTTAKQAFDEFIAKLRTLEGLLGILMLLKILFEYYLKKESDKIWGPISDFEQGDLAMMLESGKAREDATRIALAINNLEHAMEMAFPMMQGAGLVSAVANLKVNPESAVGAFAYAIGKMNIPDGVKQRLEPMREIVVRLSTLNRKLSVLIPVAGQVRRTDPQVIRDIVHEIKTVLQEIPEITREIPSETLPAGYFERGAILAGLPPLEPNPLAAMREWGFTVWNSTNQRASDLHVTLRGSGGSLKNPRIVVQPEGCGQGRASIGGGGNRVDVVWDADCVPPGGTVVILVETQHVPLEIDNVVWTLKGKPIQ